MCETEDFHVDLFLVCIFSMKRIVNNFPFVKNEQSENEKKIQ